MNLSHKIQIALSTILLWSSTAISSFASTHINLGKLEPIAIQVPAESIPRDQLNLILDSYLMAQRNRTPVKPPSLRDRRDDLIGKFNQLGIQEAVNLCGDMMNRLSNDGNCVWYLIDWAIDKRTQGQLSDQVLDALMEAVVSNFDFQSRQSAFLMHNYREKLAVMTGVYISKTDAEINDEYISKFEDALDDPDAPKIVNDFCHSHYNRKECFVILVGWVTVKREVELNNCDLMNKLKDIQDRIRRDAFK